MPDNTRYFDVIRCNTPYYDSEIVCDWCGDPFIPPYYYEIVEGNRRTNSFPFHTIACCDNYIRDRFFYKCTPNYELNVVTDYVSISDFFKEETTED